MKLVLLKHLFVISLAVNVVMISKFLFNEDKKVQDLGQKVLFDAGGPRSENSKLEKKNKHSDRSSSPLSSHTAYDGDAVIDLERGDPTMYERYWQRMGDKTTIIISGWQSISYFSDVKSPCWFLESEFSNAVVRVHKLVGNAITEGRHIVVGTGSTQLFQAVLYALCPTNITEPISVVSAAPFYSAYPLITDCLKSGLYKWGGDAYKFSKEKPYIELVTSPNNPDGSSRQPVVNGNEGILVHDLAYYWPQYAPISFAADHDIMLFTVSKSTGHAGTRIGWALVKDQDIAKRMTKFIELNTIGVSKDSQLRTAKILNSVADSIEDGSKGTETFFEYGNNLMERRWNQLRAAVNKSELFSLPSFSSGTCTFSGQRFEPQPGNDRKIKLWICTFIKDPCIVLINLCSQLPSLVAFAWLKCEAGIEDCESFLREHKILTRGGKHFGVSSEYVRISMVDRDETFDLLIERMSKINS